MSKESQAAFRKGFATELAKNGLTPEQLMDKAAAGLLGDMLGAEAITGAAETIPEALKDVATTAGELGKWGLIGLPLAVGTAGGYLSQAPSRTSDEDVAALREQDLIERYKRATEQLKRRQTQASVRT